MTLSPFQGIGNDDKVPCPTGTTAGLRLEPIRYEVYDLIYSAMTAPFNNATDTSNLIYSQYCFSFS